MNNETKSVPEHDLAAELAALGEECPDEAELAWSTRAQRREARPTNDLVSTDAAQDQSPALPAELSQTTMTRVWGRIERRWWLERLRTNVSTTLARIGDLLAPRTLAWASVVTAALIVGVQTIDTDPRVSDRDQELAALGAIARAALEERSVTHGTIETGNASQLPPMRWTTHLAGAAPANARQNEL